MAIARKARRASACVQPCPTIIEIILDETGSMSSCKAGTLSGFNTFLQEQRSQDGLALLTLTKFSTYNTTTPYTDLDVTFAPDLNHETFVPSGGTNLRDTIGARIAEIERRTAGFTQKPNVLVVVLTDGDDNASRLQTEQSIRSLIEARNAQEWTFVYLGATPGSLATAQRLGFLPGNSRQFDTRNIHQTMTDISRSTTTFRASGSTQTFFA